MSDDEIKVTKGSGDVFADLGVERPDWARNYPDDGGLKEPVRRFEDTFSAEALVMARFFPRGFVRGETEDVVKKFIDGFDQGKSTFAEHFPHLVDSPSRPSPEDGPVGAMGSEKLHPEVITAVHSLLDTFFQHHHREAPPARTAMYWMLVSDLATYIRKD